MKEKKLLIIKFLFFNKNCYMFSSLFGVRLIEEDYEIFVYFIWIGFNGLGLNGYFWMDLRI